MDRIDYIEQQAQRLAAFRLESMELLNKRAHTLTTLLLGAGAGAAGYGVGLMQSRPWAGAGLLAASAWLFAVGFLTVWTCLRTVVVLPPGEEPAHLLPESARPLSDLREGCLRSLDDRMRGWASRNAQVGIWLNRCYLAACLSPVAMGVGAAAWALAAAGPA